ncbi:MAG TPA: hypothetical protein VGD56_07005 [Gemmatirosa sp.]
MLWTVVAVAACALATAVAGREAVASATNRVALTRAGWRAEDCAARALAATDAALAGTSAPRAATLPGEPPSATVWRTLDQQLHDVADLPHGCQLTVTPVDTLSPADSGSANEAATLRTRPMMPLALQPMQPPGPAARGPVAPDLWTVTARASEGVPAVLAVLELRVARSGVRPAIVRRRTWVE